MNSAGTAAYLVGHGPFHKPRLIELQYRRIMRYRVALGDRAGSSPDIFTDLNSPRSQGGPRTPQEMPELMMLLDGVHEKKYALVLMDLEDGAGFEQGPLALIRPSLEEAGAKVLNAFYDDEKVLEQSLKQRFGKRALVDDITDGSDMVCFFSGLASEVSEAALRKELRGGSVHQVNERIDGLKRLKPYAGGALPFVEDRLSLEWKLTK